MLALAKKDSVSNPLQATQSQNYLKRKKSVTKRPESGRNTDIFNFRPKCKAAANNYMIAACAT